MTKPKKEQKRGGVRHIDHLGRLVVPVDIRRQFGWAAMDQIEFFVEGENVIVRSVKVDERKKEALANLYAVVEKEWDQELKKTLKETIKLIEGEPNWNYNG